MVKFHGIYPLINKFYYTFSVYKYFDVKVATDSRDFMRKKFILIELIVFFSFGTHTASMAQQQESGIDEEKSVSDLVGKAQSIYGINDLLYRGLLYIPDHPKAESHPYFTNKEWNRGSITLAGDRFDQIDIKYNVNLNLLIIKKQEAQTGAHQPVIIDNSIVDEFVIGDFTFTNLQRFDSADLLKGFGEILFNGKFIFYKKYSKDFINRYSQSNPYGQYSKLNTSHFIYQAGIKSRIRNKRALLNYFEDFRKPLKKYMRKEKFKFSKASKEEFYQLMKFCEQHL